MLEQFIREKHSPITKRMYRASIKQAEDYIGYPFSHFTREDATTYKTYLLSMTRERKLSLSTVRYRLSVLKQYGDFMLSQDPEYIYSPFSTLTLPKVEKSLDILHVPSLEECDTLLSSFDIDSGEFLIFALALRCCMSCSILCQMHSNQFFEKKGKLYYHQINELGDRAILIPDDITTIVKERIFKGGYFFLSSKGEPMALRTFRYKVRKLLDQLGFQNYSLSDFRSRAVIEMMAAGANEDEIADYTGLVKEQLSYYKKALNHTRNINPCEMSRIRITCNKKGENAS